MKKLLFAFLVGYYYRAFVKNGYVRAAKTGLVSGVEKALTKELDAFLAKHDSEEDGVSPIRTTRYDQARFGGPTR